MDVREGAVTITVPGTSEEEIEEDVFYNPNQEFNRDLTIAVLRAYRDQEPRARSYLDAMAASGIRGLRAAADGWDVTLCDRDENAIELIQANLAQNDLAATVEQRNVNAYLHESIHDVVDIDPYGSPMPFAAAAFAGTRGMCCFTATDTAPLCGAHFNAGVRRYDTVPRNTEYHREMGLRVLLGSLARVAARQDRAITPLLSHATRHYVRVYLDLESGGGVADDSIRNCGFLAHCEDCLARETEQIRIPDLSEQCPHCGSNRMLHAGPIWLGPIRDSEFVDTVEDHVTDELATADRIDDFLDTLRAELDTPTHYDQHRLAKAWSRSATSMDEFIANLRDAGHEASRAHYSGTAFKTTADVEEIRAATSGNQ